MRSCRILRTVCRLGFPLCGWLSLALFVFVISGLPIPVPFARDVSQAFPCMFHRCGCRDAQQCWKSCCCHTPSQRLAWAKAHDVQPPAEVAERLKADCPDGSCETRQPCCAKQPAKQPALGISLIAALKCRGQHELTAGVPICLPPHPLDWQPMLSVVDRSAAVLPSILCWIESPPDPPPRAANC
jgi:hypothetical protein